MINHGEMLRWLRWGALVLVFVLAASALSAWQFERRSERVAQIQLVLDNYDRPPVPIDQIAARATSSGLVAEEWRPVEVTGSYVPGTERLVRNRPLAGRAGFLQLAAFKLADGQILIVERGWLPTGSSGGLPEETHLISPGERTLIFRLRLPETSDPAPSATGSISAVNLDYFAGIFATQGQVMTDFYGRLVTERPSDASYPLAMPKPSLNEGNHLSYALQWILFGLLAVVALIWAIRRECMTASGSAPKRHTSRLAEEDARAEDGQ